MRGKPNLFQASMLRWRALHPYNAVHVVTLPGPIDGGRLSKAIGRTLEAWGLTGLELATDGSFEYRGGPANPSIETSAVGSAPDQALEQTVERELNHRYPAYGRFDPFRFFALDGPASFRLGLAYDHFIAAGDSIVMLLRDIVAAYAEPDAPKRPAPPERYPPRCRTLMLRDPVALLRGALRLPEMVGSCRRSVRPRYPRGTDGHNGFALFHLCADDLARLKRTAKGIGVTLNDLLLALMLCAVAPFAGHRDRLARRHEIGIASIMNIRREFGVPADAFGQFLSSFRLSHPLPEGIDVRALARDIGARTAEIKRRKLYLQTLLAMAMAASHWRFMSEDQRATLHAKNYPTWAGLSNLDVNAIWAAAGGGEAPDYIRAVPTGPLSPVVLAATTARDALHLGFSFRTTAFDRENIAKMSSSFAYRLQQLPA